MILLRQAWARARMLGTDHRPRHGPSAPEELLPTGVPLPDVDKRPPG